MSPIMTLLTKGVLEQRHHLRQRSHTSHPTAYGHSSNRGWQRLHAARGNNKNNNNNSNKQEASRQKYVQHRKGESEKADDYLAYFGLER